MILGIETSCDDTCAAVYDSSEGLLSNIISSQDKIHNEFQGIVPELASREHCKAINVVLKKALEEACIDWQALESVAVTYGPGLIGSLLTGIAASKSITARHNIPLVPVNHISAHIYSIFLEQNPNYPFICMVASGGHTALFQVDGPHHFDVLGHTRDDAVGEAYDKVAKMMELGYPGGPEIEKLAENGNPEAIDFPRPTLKGRNRWNWHYSDFDFSFSGIKTAVYYYLRDNEDVSHADVAASFQRAVNDVVVYKTIKAAQEGNIPRIVLGGGVAANGALRRSFREQSDHNIDVFFPSLQLCTDNAAMIAYRSTHLDRESDMLLNAQPRLSEFTPKKVTEEKITECN